LSKNTVAPVADAQSAELILPPTLIKTGAINPVFKAPPPPLTYPLLIILNLKVVAILNPAFKN
jgi:hypothetical protein